MRPSQQGEEFAPQASPFPDDVISALLRRLVRSGGLLEPHHHGGPHVSLSETLALRELVDSSNLAQNDLAERLGLEKSTVSRLVAGMEHRGWVSRDRDRDNRRYVRLALTAQGAQVARRIGFHFREQHHALLAGLTREEIEALSVGLTALARVLAETRPAGHSTRHSTLGAVDVSAD